jgi:hypothetical protein
VDREPESISHFMDSLTLFNFAAMAHVLRALHEADVLTDEARGTIHNALRGVSDAAEGLPADAPGLHFLDAVVRVLPPLR